jgi:hypothetical protein
MNDAQREQLRNLAQAATPGKWKWWTSNSFMRLTAEGAPDGGVLHGSRLSDGCCTITISKENAAFIEVADPTAILELLAALEQRSSAEPVVYAWFHRGMVNFDADCALAALDDGKGTPIKLYLAPPDAAAMAARIKELEAEVARLKGGGTNG